MTTLDQGLVERLNSSEGFLALVRRAVKDVYRYSGLIELHWDDDIPF